MDRDKVSKPTAQIGFIKFVLIPLFELLNKVRIAVRTAFLELQWILATSEPVRIPLRSGLFFQAKARVHKGRYGWEGAGLIRVLMSDTREYRAHVLSQ